MKKKLSLQDKKDWLKFIKGKEKIFNKDNNLKKSEEKIKKEIIDLHGYSLKDANLKIKNFINRCYEKNVGEINIITGKGKRSKIEADPYLSKDLSILKYSVPNYINSQEDLMKKIKKINLDEVKDLSKGNFTIFLKKIKE